MDAPEISNNESDENRRFCVYPLVEQVVLPPGTVGFCCVAHEGGPVQKGDGTSHRLPDDTLGQAWNSDHQKQLRLDQMAGRKTKGCELCYYQESIGKRSYRQLHNEEWTSKFPEEIKKRKQEVLSQGGHLNDGPMYLDLRLGNLCNLKCRMCNPYNSSKIESEYRNLLQTDGEFSEFYKKVHGGGLPKTTKWYEDDAFWSSVESAIPSLKKVYLTGGEPTLIKKNQWFLNRCIELGQASEMELMFNINSTRLEDDFLRSLTHFKFVLVNVSVDGFGPINEYIRSGSDWAVIESHIRKLLNQPGNIQVGLTPVVQIYNVLYLDELLDFVDELHLDFKKDINVDFLYATDPRYLDIRYLPMKIKDKARLKLQERRLESPLYQSNFFYKNSVDSCLTALNQSPPEQSDQYLEQFFTFTRIMDRARGESWEEVMPELHKSFLELT